MKRYRITLYLQKGNTIEREEHWSKKLRRQHVKDGPDWDALSALARLMNDEVVSASIAWFDTKTGKQFHYITIPGPSPLPEPFVSGREYD